MEVTRNHNLCSTLSKKKSSAQMLITDEPRDFFIEGQMSVRSPKARYGLTVLRTSQHELAKRLSVPKNSSNSPAITDKKQNSFESPSRLRRGADLNQTLSKSALN